MKRVDISHNSSGFAMLILILFLSIILVALVSVSIKNHKQTYEKSIVPTSDQGSPQIPFGVSSPNTSNFQVLADQLCNKENNLNPDPEMFPVSVDQTVVHLVVPFYGCFYGYDPSKYKENYTEGKVLTISTDGGKIYIHDGVHTEREGEGPSYMRTYGGLIEQTGDTIYSAFLGLRMGGTQPGDVPVYIRGVRKFTNHNGMTFYVTATREAISKDDNGLVDFLTEQNTYKCPLIDGECIIVDEDLDNRVAEHFFLVHEQSDEPESTELINLKHLLDAVSLPKSDSS